jgi:[ribosomal protein S5]-alanine N-acetyltransferase
MSKTKKIPTELQGERIIIRRLRMSDAEDLYRHLKSRDVSRWLMTVPYPYSKDEAVKFIRKSMVQWRQQTSYHFAILLKENGGLIGGCAFRLVDFEHECVGIGYWLGKKYWHQGYATETAKLLLHLGFDVLGLYRVYAGHIEPNAASGRVLEKCGMTREGVWREAIIKHGERQNMVHYAILKPEYEKQVCKKAETKK